jgi:hypothetical protein
VKGHQLSKFVRVLFEDRRSLDNWVTDIEIVERTKLFGLNETEKLELADMSIFRDLGPLGRQLR